MRGHDPTCGVRGGKKRWLRARATRSGHVNARGRLGVDLWRLPVERSVVRDPVSDDSRVAHAERFKLFWSVQSVP